MPGARRTHSLACNEEKHTSFSHHRSADASRHSLRGGFTVSFVLARRPGFVVSVAPEKR
jgi:hypothetical protein